MTSESVMTAVAVDTHTEGVRQSCTPSHEPLPQTPRNPGPQALSSVNLRFSEFSGRARKQVTCHHHGCTASAPRGEQRTPRLLGVTLLQSGLTRGRHTVRKSHPQPKTRGRVQVLLPLLRLLHTCLRPRFSGGFDTHRRSHYVAP